MRKVIGVAAILLSLFVPAGARADEIQGRVTAVDAHERVMTLENGTKLWVAEGVSMEAAKEGASVKASYEERDGKKIATSLEITVTSAGSR
jgi:hypothetical protein